MIGGKILKNKKEVGYDMKNEYSKRKKRKKVSIWAIMPMVMVRQVMKNTLLLFQGGLNFLDGGNS